MKKVIAFGEYVYMPERVRHKALRELGCTSVLCESFFADDLEEMFELVETYPDFHVFSFDQNFEGVPFYRPGEFFYELYKSDLPPDFEVSRKLDKESTDEEHTLGQKYLDEFMADFRGSPLHHSIVNDLKDRVKRKLSK